MNRLRTALKAARQMGLGPLALYGKYQFMLRSGYLRRQTPSEVYQPLAHLSLGSAPFSAAVAVQGAEELLAEADELCAGRVRLFGGPPVPLQLSPAGPLAHWTEYETGHTHWDGEDIKLIWEPARFGWVCVLARAYVLTQSEQYAQCFWDHFTGFLKGNPPNQGPNWTSAQEVALRLLAFLFAAQVFERSLHSTPNRMALLRGAMAAHAGRIPPTLDYARSQNNNHLICEALGLYAAGCALTELPEAAQWKQTGWHWLNEAFQKQIAPDGTYSQHSTNYHRLMLQAALWAQALAARQGETLPQATLTRLAAATRWLLARLDSISGRVPNLGWNDGAYIFPLAPGGFGDMRPVLQAAARVFLGEGCLPSGPWDEYTQWLDTLRGAPASTTPDEANKIPADRHILRRGAAWASLRAERYTSRPAHADQLHVELWWRGHNLARDAGTYRYNAPAPWNNALAGTSVHNTVQVDEQDQMRRAGRFLWLDWAQAEPCPTDNDSLCASHDGYARLGVHHRREVRAHSARHWQINDFLESSATPDPTPNHTLTLHWLLPDWPWQLDAQTLRLQSPQGEIITLNWETQTPGGTPAAVQLIRAGQVLAGPQQALPTLGWYSPTYDLREPALAVRITLTTALPAQFTSQWLLPD